MSILTWCRESLLAFSTGAGAGGSLTYFASRSVWQQAQAQGQAIDTVIEDMRDLRGLERPPPAQARPPCTALHPTSAPRIQPPSSILARHVLRALLTRLPFPMLGMRSLHLVPAHLRCS